MYLSRSSKRTSNSKKALNGYPRALCVPWDTILTIEALSGGEMKSDFQLNFVPNFDGRGVNGSGDRWFTIDHSA